MLKARIYHPLFFASPSSEGGHLDRSSSRMDTSIIVEAHGQDGTRSWNVRDTVRPGEKYFGRTFEELADLIAAGCSEVEL